MTITLQMGGGSRDYITRRNQRRLDVVRSGLTDEAFEQAWAEGCRLGEDELVALALHDPSLAE